MHVCRYFISALLTCAACVSAFAAPGAITRLGYAIQMGAFSDVRNAERFSAKLNSKGIDAFYFRKDNGVYAVRFGDFPTREKARAAANRLVADKLIDSYYVAPPNEIVFARPGSGSQNVPSGGVQTPQHQIKPVVPKDNPPAVPQKPRGSDRDMGVIAARTAERFVGIPYRWGGDNVVEGMDCSGFVRAVYNLCGLSIPRTSRDQFKAGERVTLDNLRDGDLVFFGSSESSINHVGIFVGSGRFVHAPRRGEDIRVTLVSDNYFEKRFVGARRYF
ncbi:MAG: NlpC/P60 family protein [Desulfuromonadales bacterium]